MHSDIIKWDLRFLKLSDYWANMCSKDPSTKVGAVIVDGNRLVSMGYNGFPQGVDDTEERLNDRSIKYEITLHGEENALILAGRSVEGCTIYTTPFMPCSRCAIKIIQHGISRVVAPINNNPRWIENFKLTQMLFDEAGVQLDLYDLYK